MKNEIINFISNYVTLTEEEIEILNNLKVIKKYKKDDILLKASEYSQNCFFILSGCVRSYYLIDGEERNTEFYVESETITPVSYITKKPSEYYISCLEESIISVGTPEQSKILIKKIPKLQKLILELNESLIVKKQILLDDFKNLNPEQRYLKLLKTRPDLLNRIPQYHLSTFLGITPVSLSRLRKRITQK